MKMTSTKNSKHSVLIRCDLHCSWQREHHHRQKKWTWLHKPSVHLQNYTTVNLTKTLQVLFSVKLMAFVFLLVFTHITHRLQHVYKLLKRNTPISLKVVWRKKRRWKNQWFWWLEWIWNLKIQKLLKLLNTCMDIHDVYFFSLFS